MATRKEKAHCLWSRGRRFFWLILVIVGFITVQVHQFSRPRLVAFRGDLSPLDVKEEKLEARRLDNGVKRLDFPSFDDIGAHLEVLRPWDDERRSYLSTHTRLNEKHKRIAAEKETADIYSGRSRTTEVGNVLRSKLRQTLEKKSKAGQTATKEKQDSWWALQKEADDAFAAGEKAWDDLQIILANDSSFGERSLSLRNEADVCHQSLTISGWELQQAGQTMLLPCGLVAGSAITVVGKPRTAHMEYMPKISKVDDTMSVAVSQFVVELQGLKIAHGEEDPPRILHFNPRVKGDWSQRPVIEQNTCYRGQWGAGQRCDGTPSPEDADTVEELVKCEQWIRDEDDPGEGKKSSWLDRWIGRTEKSKADWKYPFTEEQTFVLTIRAGYEGYHLTVDGRHITSFPYRTSFVVEEATGVSVGGDVDVYSLVATALPTSYPSFSPEQLLEQSALYKAPELPFGAVELFIGIMSGSDYFAERMAVRKTWMQSKSIQASKVVGRFFVALHADQAINAQLKREADFYGDVVIVPYMDSYQLVVLKTVAICEYGITKFNANYIMKCDDDTFVKVETILKLVRATSSKRSLYMGNINYYHPALRHGKWAVTHEEWSGEVYPPYANGPGYVISADIAKFVLGKKEEQSLRLFKMEDVAVGIWVAEFGQVKPVEIVDDLKFCQRGCVRDYYTSHYQTPRLMMCLWEKLISGDSGCCES